MKSKVQMGCQNKFGMTNNFILKLVQNLIY